MVWYCGCQTVSLPTLIFQGGSFGGGWMEATWASQGLSTCFSESSSTLTCLVCERTILFGIKGVLLL